jgi:D-beta-D-heptose 7-phosphate kinase/D-beta-D-heptose 1-phosphate adenosyltransferase
MVLQRRRQIRIAKAGAARLNADNRPALDYTRQMSLRTAAETRQWIEGLQRQNRRVVFTNGVFDLLHPGHVRYLRAARERGDALVVGINSDRSVSANKGPGRPIVPEGERAELLEALAFVDAVVIFDEETPHELIATLQPDVLVKGADWAADAIVGRDLVESWGGQVERMPVEAGHSTSAIIRKIRGMNPR